MYDCRELYLANLERNITKADIKQAFKKYGSIESVRIPTKVDGTSKGIGFVVFRSKVSSTPPNVLLVPSLTAD